MENDPKKYKYLWGIDATAIHSLFISSRKIATQFPMLNALYLPCINRRLLFVFCLLFVKYKVGDAIPGVMNADEKQQQCRSSNAKQSLARM